MLARLDAAATTAVKAPVVASVEYNYERDGIFVVPAGANVIGEVHPASAQGYLSVRFHTLQMPNGTAQKIEGSAMGVDRKPLKGDVSGKNTGKKFCEPYSFRSRNGRGLVVGAGGAGLSRTITGETLLSDCLASNIALAGKQELMNVAYSQDVTGVDLTGIDYSKSPNERLSYTHSVVLPRIRCTAHHRRSRRSFP